MQHTPSLIRHHLPKHKYDRASTGHLLYGPFFFNDPATTQISTLSLHDALPISPPAGFCELPAMTTARAHPLVARSEEHTSELQSLTNLVCRLLLEKKKKTETTLKSIDIKQSHIALLSRQCESLHIVCLRRHVIT